MATDVPSFDFIFRYLVTHNLDEAKDFFDPGWKAKESRYITLDVPDGPLIVSVGNPATVFEASSLKLLPGTKFKHLKKAHGTFYTRSGVPQGYNVCWIQQYPPLPGVLEPGRTVVEFYTDKGITGVFKTNIDNFGASGKACWIPVNRQA